MQKTNKILVILTSSKDFPSTLHTPPSSTGFDIKEVAYIYHYLVKEGSHQVDFASPKGSRAPIDPLSVKASERDQIVQDFMKSPQAMQQVTETKRIADITPSDYAAIIFPGGAGAMLDLPNEHQINDVVATCLRDNKGIVAAIGHGIAALLNVKDPRAPGQPLLKDKRVTCNTIEEEREMELDKALPFMLEKKLREIGAKFEKQDKFQSNVVVDERIITGQNRNSSKEWAEQIRNNL